MSRRKLREFVIDPSSGQYSASRFLLMVLILIHFPIMLALEAQGIKLGMWAQFAIIVSSVAGIYWFNSTARAWKDPAPPAPRGPKEPEGEK